MGKKGNLLTEAQVRQFMKLANLTPLTPGFVEGLESQGPNNEFGSAKHPDHRTKKLGDAGLASQGPGLVKEDDEDDGDEAVEESHGRGRGEGAGGYGHEDQNSRLEEDEDPMGDPMEEPPMEEPPMEDPMEDPMVEPENEIRPTEGAREVSVDDFLIALEQALETVLGDEVEVDQEEDPEEEPVDMEAPDDDMEAPVDMEEPEEMELQEMVNKITKRVAKRIVREALQNKK